MEKRTLIALALAFIILLAYQFFIVGPQPQNIQKPVEKTDEQKAIPFKPEASPVPLSEPLQPLVTEKEVKVETALYSAVFSTSGATLKHYELKNYEDKTGKNLILLKSPGIEPPLGIGAKDEFELSRVNFHVTGEDLILNENERTGSLIFEYSNAQLFIKRTYTFNNDTYKIEINDQVSGLPDYWITLGTDFGIHDNTETSAHVGPVILKDADRIELNAKNLNEAKVYKEGLKWIAQEDKYFFAALVPLTGAQEAKFWKKKDKVVPAFNAKPGTNSFILYAGPKEYDRLKALNLGLEHIVDFGFFSVIAVPLFWILKLFYKITGNYGWAIILLTLLIRIPFIPLVNKSQKSMKKLQELQPRMAEIKEKYKKDPQRMQKEMMELYKKQKVNPLGGCLPILLQIPIFFALYKILLISIELRRAPFMLWINDLSAPDSLFGHIPQWFPLIGGFAVGPLPILMGASMIIQQKMTPTSLDPTQNKIMMMMPVVFTFLFLNFASGLVLYWFMNNVFSVIQQFYANKKLAKERA